MGGSITAFAYDAHRGALRHVQTISTLAADFKGKNESAEIATDASGKFLYASNRGPDSIAVFTIERGKGTLRLVEHISTKGKTPRNFAIDPSGKYLFAANQDSNNIVVFRIDARTGRLTDTGQVIDAPSPVCLTFVAAD
jgi:6-phosphogluconolactonase